MAALLGLAAGWVVGAWAALAAGNLGSGRRGRVSWFGANPLGAVASIAPLPRPQCAAAVGMATSSVAAMVIPRLLLAGDHHAHSWRPASC